MQLKQPLHIPTELLSHLRFFLSHQPCRCHPRGRSRSLQCSLIIQIPAAASSDTPLCCLHIIITFTCILPSFFLSFFFFCDASARFGTMAPHRWGFETLGFHEVRMSAPRTTPHFEGQGIWHRSRNFAPWVALPAECRRRGFPVRCLMTAPSPAQMCLRQFGSITEGL